jgi:putative endopeptidase
MKRTISLCTVLFPAAALFLAACAGSAPPPAPAAAPATATAVVAAPAKNLEFDRANLDPTVSACTDFYQYANGGWLAKNPIPPQYPTWGMLSGLQQENREVLREILEAAANKPAAQRTPVEQKIGDFYASCMNAAQSDAAGLKPLQPELDRIDAVTSTSALLDEFAHLQAYSINTPFNFAATQDAKNSEETIAAIQQDGLGLPDRDYYFRTDEQSKKIRDEYVAHIRNMFQLAGVPGDAGAVMRLETALAQASLTAVQQRDPASQYNRMTVAQLASLAPHFDWPAYLAQRGLPGIESVNVMQPGFLKEADRLVAATPLADWQSYLRWQLLTSVAPALTTAISDENFRFRSGVLLGQKQQQDRWQRCVARTDQQIGEALGQAYVDRRFPAAAKQRANEMVVNLRAALKETLTTLPWMAEQTRKNALAKLEAFHQKIGYPDTWRDYSAVEIGNGPMVTNVLALRAFETKRDLAKVGLPPDRGEWGMTPPTINAYYNPPLNEIVFPAGILQWPMFDVNQDDAFNYGAAGSVIGHEITHGFDDEGSQYDAKGNLVNWWTAEDRKRFDERAECIVDQFNHFEIEPGVAHNGKLVAGESIADLGGAIIAYDAWQKSLAGKPRPKNVGGFTPEQRFFLGFARARAANQTIEFARNRVLTNPHPISKFRVNGPVSNMPQFAAAFQCKSGDPMVRANSCAIW